MKQVYFIANINTRPPESQKKIWGQVFLDAALEPYNLKLET